MFALSAHRSNTSKQVISNPPPYGASPSSLRVANETAGQDRIASVNWADLQLVLERSVLDGAHAPKVSALPAPPLALIQ